MLSCWSGQKGGQDPSCGSDLLAALSCAGQAEEPGSHSLRCSRSSACLGISSPTHPTAVWSYWEIPAPPRPCHHNAKLTSGNLQQWNIILEVCEGMGANAAGEKGAAPEEGLGGFSVSQICCCHHPEPWGHPLVAASSMATSPQGQRSDRRKASVKNNNANN